MKKQTQYTIREAAEILRLTEQLIRAYCRAGVFPGAEKIRGTRWRIPARDLQELVDDKLDVSGIFARD